MKADIVQRIEKLMQLKKLNQSELSNMLGYKSSEKISRLFRFSNAKPSYDIIKDISNKFEDLNIQWLITGKGCPLLKSKAGAIKEHIQSNILANSKDEIISLQREVMLLKDERIKFLETKMKALGKNLIL